MGKQTNPQVLRFLHNYNWPSKFYSSPFNYSNITERDFLVREHVINFMSFFNTKVAQVYIYRYNHHVVIRIFSYNDSFTNWKSFLTKHKKKVYYRNKLYKSQVNIHNSGNGKPYSWFNANIFRKDVNLTNEFPLVKNNKHINFIRFNNSVIKKDGIVGYSGKRLLALNLSYLLRTNVIIKNTNIINKDKRALVLKTFSNMGLRLKSPLSPYLRTKFICLVYYSLLYKSSLLLCRYLRFIIPRFCKKKRKNRKINPFLKSLKSVINLMFSKPFSKQIQVKGIKVQVKGRINGSRRKRIYVIKKGHTSLQSFRNEFSYYQEDCLTIFGILGIKVWIIY
jgi:hypothetical protein